LVASSFFDFFKGFFAMVVSSGLASPFQSRGLPKLYANAWPMSITTCLRVYLLANLCNASLSPSSTALALTVRAE
jgi:antibiotic biosynthesis monooxygenase (ABM) superfamily enzyme